MARAYPFHEHQRCCLCKNETTANVRKSDCVSSSDKTSRDAKHTKRFASESEYGRILGSSKTMAREPSYGPNRFKTYSFHETQRCCFCILIFAYVYKYIYMCIYTYIPSHGKAMANTSFWRAGQSAFGGFSFHIKRVLENCQAFGEPTSPPSVDFFAQKTHPGKFSNPGTN